MSFLSVIGNIGKGLAIGVGFAAPAVTLFNPAVGALMTGLVGKLQTSIITTEAAFTDSQSGELKERSVVDAFVADLALTQEVLAVRGEKLTYDEGKLKKAIASQVQAYNDFASLKSSFKIEKA